VHTKDLKSYDYMGVQTDRGPFEFQVKFCEEAIIGLSTTPGDPNIVYEIVLGEKVHSSGFI
jgi:hypothetical protein